MRHLLAVAMLAFLPKVDDVRYGGRGSEPIPLAPTPVRLRSAEILVAQVPVKDGWQVTASYELHNPTTAALTVPVLLPEQGCPPQHECSGQVGTFQDLGTRLGEQLVEAQAAPADAVRPFADPPQKGYLYPLTLAPGQTTRLAQEYLFDQSRGSRYWDLGFLSSAGRWGGAIERERYTVELRQPALYVIYPRAFKLESFREQAAPSGGAVIRLVLTATGVAKRSDLRVLFPADALDGQTAAGSCDGFRGDHSDEELAPIVARYPPALLRACRERLLSLHGAPAAVKADHVAPHLPAGLPSQDFAVAVRPANPAFGESLLSPGEQSYLRALKEAERHAGK